MASKPITTWRARKLAVEASVDPRTILAVLDGRQVRGMAGERARKVLVEAGLLKDEREQESRAA